MNSEWRTDTPEKDGIYLTATYGLETGILFRSLSNFLNGEWLNNDRYYVLGWLPIPELPEAPKDVPQVEKITWYPISIKPNEPDFYFVKSTTIDGVTIYDAIKYNGTEWSQSDFSYWAVMQKANV